MKRPRHPLADFSRRAFLGAMGGIAAGLPVPKALSATLDEGRIPNDSELTTLFGMSHSRRGTANYELWRQSMIWQRRKSARYPDLIVQATSAADVAAAVKYAGRRGLRVATRCGGHSMSACFLRERGLLLDVGQLQGIEIDTARKEAVVGPGVIARGFSERLREVGLAFPTAHCGMVPLGGFLLGGGLGFNGNGWGGLSVFNIKAAEVVTADGDVHTASPTENPDLYWALRGGGPGLFGVVTKFHLQLYELPKTIAGTTLSFRFADLEDVAHALSEIGPRTAADVELVGYIGRAADDLLGKLTPADSRLAMHLHANAFAGSMREAQKMTRPLLDHPIAARAIARDLHRVRTLEELYSEEELGFSQRRWVCDNVFTNRVQDVMKVLRKRMPEAPAADSQAVLVYKALKEMPDAACSTMGDFYASFYALWDDPSEDTRNREYIESLYREIAPLGVGSNINEMNQEGRREDIPRCYSPQAWKRLADLRAKWDPQRVFHDFYSLS